MVAAAMLAAPSCIKNDEPVGIEEMRKGKAELLKAEAAVQLAEAKLKEAEIAYTEALARQEDAKTAILTAQAAQEEAKAEQEKLETEKKKLEVELQQAQNEEEKARLAAEIAKHEAQQAKYEAEKTKNEALAAAAVEEAKATLLNAQKKAAQAEKDYQDAMAALEASLIVDADSEYTAALETVISNLNDSRSEIARLQKAIAQTTGHLYNVMTNDKIWVRNLQTDIAKGEKEVALYTEQIAYWTALSEANEVKWGEELETAKAKEVEAINKEEELKKAYEEAQTKISPIYEKWNEAYEPLNEEVALSIPVNKKLQNVLWEDFYNASIQGQGNEYEGRSRRWWYDDQTEAFTLNLPAGFTYNNVARVQDMLLVTYSPDANVEEAYDGLIFDLRKHILLDNDIVNAEQRKTALEAEAAAKAATYTKDLEAFNKALTAFKEAAAAYKLDWTQNIYLQTTLRNDVIAAIDAFNKKVAEGVEKDPEYAPTADEQKAIATTVSDYVKKRSAFDAQIDAVIEVTSADGKVTEVLTSDFMISSADVIKTYVADNCAKLVALTANEIEDWNLTEEKTVSAALTDASNKAFGIAGWVMAKFKDEDFKFYSSYYGSLPLINPIHVYDALGQTTEVEWVGGSMAASELTAAEVEYWTITIAQQAEIAKVIEAAEAIYNQYKEIALTVDKAVDAVNEELEQAEAAVTEAEAAYEAAQTEHTLCSQTVSEIEGYIKQGVGETSTNPDYSNIAIVNNVKQHIETLTNDLNWKADQLERDKNLLKVYEETGFTDAYSIAVAEYEADIENYKTQLEAEQLNFDKLVAKKDQLLELLKNEK